MTTQAGQKKQARLLGRLRREGEKAMYLRVPLLFVVYAGIFHVLQRNTHTSKNLKRDNATGAFDRRAATSVRIRETPSTVLVSVPKTTSCQGDTAKIERDGDIVLYGWCLAGPADMRSRSPAGRKGDWSPTASERYNVQHHRRVV